MIRKRSLSKSLSVVVMLASAAACGGGEEAPPAEEAGPPEPVQTAAPNTDLAAQGREVFHGPGLCFTCHGQEGVGTPLGPALNDGVWLHIESPEQDLQTQLVSLISTGVPTPEEFPAPMPPMGGATLSQDQLANVAAYVASLNQ
jgi:mono/diheme cytochrome c family protein